MVECEYCKQEMLTADGCTFPYIYINGKRYERIGSGMPGDLMEGLKKPGDRCHDCGALYGHTHHLGCDNETCPRCGRQLISCDCDVTEIAKIE
jgi:hypothetical protein